MNRRQFLYSSAALTFATMMPGKSLADLACGPFVAPGVRQCEVGIQSAVADVTAIGVGGQHQSQWCWAACIEMVFRYYGHVVPQKRIVKETWGQIVNLPAQPTQILNNLNRDWVDEDGDSFSVRGDTLTANPVTASLDLAEDYPLIIGTMGHAMVLTSLVYLQGPMGNGDIVSATVRDPWPGRGRRVLTPQEWYNTMFLARIRVE